MALCVAERIPRSLFINSILAELSLTAWQEISLFWIGRPPYRVWGLHSGDNLSANEGKFYNRGIRAHKLAMEALFRLMWNAFVAWYAGHTGEDEGGVVKEEVVIKKVEKRRRNDGRCES